MYDVSLTSHRVRSDREPPPFAPKRVQLHIAFHCSEMAPSCAVCFGIASVILVAGFTLAAQAQNLRLLSMWRHVGDDGLALSPCTDAGNAYMHALV